MLDYVLNSQKEAPATTSDLWDSPYINTPQKRDPSNSNFPFQKDFTEDFRGLKKAEVKDIVKEDSMQLAMKPYLLFGQFFGLLPICGISSDDPNALRFSWKAKKVLYALVLFGITLIVAILQVCGSIMLYGLSLSSLDVIVRSILIVIHLVVFFGQSHSWGKLIVEWTNVQQQMKHFDPIYGVSVTIRRFVYMFCVGTVFLLAARVVGRMATLHECTDDLWVLLELAFLSMYYALFSLTGFTFYTAVVPAALYLHRCVLTVYDELTMITLTYCLYLRFHQLYKHLLKMRHQKMPNTYWAEMRETYNTLSHLTRLLDSHLSWMTMVCFGSNLYYICDLLLRTFSFENNNKWTSWTMLYILLFDLARTFGAALMAAMVHEESKKPLALLFSVPSDCYSDEVFRFQMQVTHDKVMISGCRFFFLTRSFVLTVAGTIATYEIVLLQLGSSSDESNSEQIKHICSSMMHIIDNQSI